MRIKELLKKTHELMTHSSDFNKLHESQLLLSKLLNKNIIEIIYTKDLEISEKKRKKFLKKIFFRNLGKPVSKLIGKKEFYSREFFVDSFTLDPRPESELIVDCVKKNKFKNHNLSILDLGTGTGCLLVSIFLELKNKNNFGVGVDVCEKALKVANKNANKFGVSKNLKFIKSNWFSNIKGKFDIIVSNPPYIKKKEINKLSNDVKNFDPHIALNGGSSGIEAYKIIAQNVRKFLNNDGFIFLEIGSEQKNDIIKIFEDYDLKKKDELKDLSKKDRVLIFKK